MKDFLMNLFLFCPLTHMHSQSFYLRKFQKPAPHPSAALAVWGLDSDAENAQLELQAGPADLGYQQSNIQHAWREELKEQKAHLFAMTLKVSFPQHLRSSATSL